MGENEEKNVCQVWMYDGKPCGREIWDKEEQKCIFHSSKVGQKKELFLKELENYIKEVESRDDVEYYDFTRFVFCEVSFDGKVFSKPTHFSGAEFQNKAFFSWAKFQNEANFSEAEFQKKAWFVGAEFQNEANFSLAEFQNEARFLRAKFQKGAFFSWAEFQNEIYFVGAKFQNKAFFSWAKFQNEAYFSGAEFQNEADFNYAEFGQIAGFREGRVWGKLSFENTTLNLADFRDLVLEKTGEVLFFNTDLSKATFLKTDLTNFSFENVTWAKRRVLFIKRNALFDELLSITSKNKEEGKELDYSVNLESVANLYRQLKKKYEDKRDYPTAGDFYAGEMEMNRLIPVIIPMSGKESLIIRKLKSVLSTVLTFQRRHFSFISFYRWFSYYGESYLSGLFWILVLWFVLTYLFMLSDLPAPGADFFTVLKHTLSVLYFTHIFQEPGSEESYLYIFGHISSIVFHSLFLLALRRRFKR